MVKMPEGPEFEKGVLNVPKAERKVMQTNLLDFVIVEIRFPTILKIRRECPEQFQEGIRDAFPLFQRNNQVQVSPFSDGENSSSYTFKTRQEDYLAQLSSESLVLRCDAYTSFEDFMEKFNVVFSLAERVLEIPFLTRIGYRLVNRIPGLNDLPREEVSQAVNPTLVGMLSDLSLGTVSAFRSEYVGLVTPDIYYRLIQATDESTAFDYLLDFDYWKANIDTTEAIEFLETCHARHFDFFWWSIGERTRKQLHGN